jgi:hypothetical protein
MRSFSIIISATVLVMVLFAVGREIEWFRLDYEHVHGLPDQSKVLR